MTATQLIYQAAGSPALEGLVPSVGRCFLCGGDLGGRGYPSRHWVKPTFTDHDKARRPESDQLCAGCFLFSERSVAAGTAGQGQAPDNAQLQPLRGRWPRTASPKQRFRMRSRSVRRGCHR